MQSAHWHLLMWSFCHFCIFIIFILLYTHFTFCAINYCFCTPELFDIRTCQGLVGEMWWACKEQPPVLWGRTVFLGSALLDCNRSPHSCTTNHTLSLWSMVISSQSYVSFEAWVLSNIITDLSCDPPMSCCNLHASITSSCKEVC